MPRRESERVERPPVLLPLTKHESALEPDGFASVISAPSAGRSCGAGMPRQAICPANFAERRSARLHDSNSRFDQTAEAIEEAAVGATTLGALSETFTETALLLGDITRHDPAFARRKARRQKLGEHDPALTSRSETMRRPGGSGSPRRQTRRLTEASPAASPAVSPAASRGRADGLARLQLSGAMTAQDFTVLKQKMVQQERLMTERAAFEGLATPTRGREARRGERELDFETRRDPTAGLTGPALVRALRASRDEMLRASRDGMTPRAPPERTPWPHDPLPQEIFALAPPSAEIMDAARRNAAVD